MKLNYFRQKQQHTKHASEALPNTHRLIHPERTQHWLCLNSGSAHFEYTFEVQLCHNAVRRVSQSKAFSNCTPQTHPAFTCFWSVHCYYPSLSQISQDSLRTSDLVFKCKYWVYTLFTPLNIQHQIC